MTRVAEALRQRQSIRAFIDRPVEREKLEAMLDAARWAPSGTNTQPWQVIALAGEAKQRLQSRFEEAFNEGVKPNPDYQYYPEDWREPFKSRRRDCGLQLYSALNIQRQDTDRRMDQWRANYRAFDAPAMLIFLMPKVMATGSYIDYGMFLQSVMLMAIEQGLATCPQAALSDYPDIVRDQFEIGSDRLVLCGMALGYADVDHRINGYRTSREQIADFVRFELD
ncbi:nitroreductase [Gammaproteobacteria bacterium]|nr:nitroreductase [Gammaproteobacteria bacterium]